jgi:hypothetical protein
LRETARVLRAGSSERAEESRKSMSVVPEPYADLLESIALAHVATIGPNGEPQSSPVWFDWDGTHLRFAQVTG